MYIPCDEFWLNDLDLWPTYMKTLSFAITFEPLEVELSYFLCTFFVMRPFQSIQKFGLVTLTMSFDLHILNF